MLGSEGAFPEEAQDPILMGRLGHTGWASVLDKAKRVVA